MPTLDIMSRQDAQRELSLTGRRGALMRQYMGYINQLEAGRAGKLIPSEGETTTALRRRLGAAAQLLGKSLVVNRQGDAIFFWVAGDASAAGLLSEKPDHELFAELRQETFGGKPLQGSSADLIREAREIREAETAGWA